MQQIPEEKRFFRWKRGWVWFGLILLALALPWSLTRRLIENSHQKALALLQQRSTRPNGPGNSADSSSAQPESASTRGIPVAELPLVGIYFGNDPAARAVLEKQLGEIVVLTANSQNSDCLVNGVLSFRAVLARMGVTVPESMTETEAAAEFLKQTQRFSLILAEWREAVAKGPWDFNSIKIDDAYQTYYNFFREVMYPLQQLLNIEAEARLRTGDADGSWSDLQAMKSTTDRSDGILSFYRWHPLQQAVQSVRLGMELDVWTDDQLTEISSMMSEENALTSTRDYVELMKLNIANHLTNIHDNQGSIQEDLSRAKSPIGRMMSQIGFTLTSDQQIADNIAVIQYQMEQPLARFDPVTGFYLGETAGDSVEFPHSKASDVSFDKFYYMYTEEYGGNFDHVAREVIREQSTIDQTRIAAALEMQRRATGQYPETLDALGDSIPRDIATGQPYLYQRNPDGGYTLWGTGIDRTSEGGDKQSDVAYVHRPAKK